MSIACFASIPLEPPELGLPPPSEQVHEQGNLEQEQEQENLTLKGLPPKTEYPE
jgi:hypothetical protein